MTENYITDVSKCDHWPVLAYNGRIRSKSDQVQPKLTQTNQKVSQKNRNRSNWAELIIISRRSAISIEAGFSAKDYKSTSQFFLRRIRRRSLNISNSCMAASLCRIVKRKKVFSSCSHNAWQRKNSFPKFCKYRYILESDDHHFVKLQRNHFTS